MFHRSHMPKIRHLRKYILPSSTIKLSTPVFSVNFAIPILIIASLASVNVMKIAGSRFSSGRDVNASQILIYFSQFTYKQSFSRIGETFAILLPIVIKQMSHFKIIGLAFLLSNIHQVFQSSKS